MIWNGNIIKQNNLDNSDCKIFSIEEPCQLLLAGLFFVLYNFLVFYYLVCMKDIQENWST